MLRRSVETTPRKRTQPSAKNLAAKNLLRISKGTCHPPPQKTKERNLPGDTKWVLEAAGEAQAANISGIILNAHTDRAGTNKYNEQLSRARLDVVGNALSAAGVSLDSSIRSSLGEDFPFVSTPDGKRGAKNRRSDFGFLTLAVIWRVVAKRRLYPQKRKSRRWFLKQPKDFIHLSPL